MVRGFQYTAIPFGCSGDPLLVQAAIHLPGLLISYTFIIYSPMTG